MSASADPEESWVVGIEAELIARRNAQQSCYHPTIFRFPPYIEAMKPQAYQPQGFALAPSFGNPTGMDQVRLQVVSEFFEQLKGIPNSGVHSWEDLCISVAGPVESAQQLRQLDDDSTGESLVSSTTARSVLTFDAVFLTVFLIHRSKDADKSQLPNFEIFNVIFKGSAALAYYIELMYKDMWLFENQIPLSLVRQVWNRVYVDASDDRFNTQIRRTILPGLLALLRWDVEFVNSSDYHLISFTECEHLLHCFYKAVCFQKPPASLLQAGRKMQNSISESRGDPLQVNHRTLPTVTELHKAGIIVRGEPGGVSDLRFVKSFFKATLYLPQIVVDDGTEMKLANLAAFEILHNDGGYKIISFLSVMNDLINTEEDARLLSKGKDPVILLNLNRDVKHVATLFNGLCENLVFRQSEEYTKLLVDVNEWCMQGMRQMFIRFVDEYLNRESLIVAYLSFVTTFLLMQTVKGFHQ